LPALAFAIAALLLPREGLGQDKAANKPPVADVPWPPVLPGNTRGTVTLTTADFLKIPADVLATRNDPGAAEFVVAKEPPTVELAFHGDLGEGASLRRLWSSWGDICVAKDGRVYVGIGDHGKDAEGDARCFLYRWDPQAKTLSQVVDMQDVVPPREGQPAWSKVHAKIDEGSGGNIIFSCTLNAGNRAGNPQYQWNAQLPGGQIYQYDPTTGDTRVFANLPPRRCSATSLYDEKRNAWWCNLEAGEGDALFGLDLKTGETIYQGHDGQVGFNRNFCLGEKGEIYFNGLEGKLMKLDPATKTVSDTGCGFPDSPGMRASSRPSKQGEIFGTTHRTNQLFRFNSRNGELKLLGPTWGTGQYTTVTELSPDERFLYYLPGSHGQAFKYGTPVVQYEIATGTRKVLAFLAPALEKQFQYVPGGSYGVKLSADGGTLYVNFNGHAADAIRPGHMRPNGFGLCGFAAIHIPTSER
jgi:hypothetical protein